MRSKILKRIVCVIAVVITALSTICFPLSSFADIEDNPLNISPYTAEIKDAYSQIKNAALVHLVAQKMKRCTEAVEAGDISYNDAEDARNGDLYYGFGSGLLRGNIATGPWLGRIIGDNGGDPGVVHCGTGGSKIFDMFVYILKYPTQVQDVKLESISVDETDRRKVLCNKDNLALPGLVQFYHGTYDGIDFGYGCNDDVGFWAPSYLPADNGMEYIKSLYNSMASASGNDYVLEWDDAAFDNYSKVDGYYLHKLNFEKECMGGGATEVSVLMVNDDGVVEEKTYNVPNKSFSSFVGDRGSWTCKAVAEKMNELIVPFLKIVNKEVSKNCKNGIDEAIDTQTSQINDKYINNQNASDSDKADAQEVLNAYSDIKTKGLYVKKQGEDDSAVESYTKIPSDYVWTCRASLPYIDVLVDAENDLAEAINNEFYDACYDAVDLAWVVCPIINGLTGITDALNSMIEDFF